MLELDLTDLSTRAYAAGLFDGSGTFVIKECRDKNHRHDVRFKLNITFWRKYSQSLSHLHAYFGGSLTKDYKGRTVWNLTTDAAHSFLLAIKPYLKNKQEQAEIGIQFARLLYSDRVHFAINDKNLEKRRALKEKLKEIKYRKG